MAVAVNGCWKWGEYSLPIVSSYYLGIDFSRNGAWDMHIRKLLDNGRKRVNHLHKVIKGRVSWSKLKRFFFNNNVPLSLENTYNFL